MQRSRYISAQTQRLTQRRAEEEPIRQVACPDERLRGQRHDAGRQRGDGAQRTARQDAAEGPPGAARAATRGLPQLLQQLAHFRRVVERVRVIRGRLRGL